MRRLSSNNDAGVLTAAPFRDRFRRRQSEHEGFTLIELMVVMLLITIMFAVSAPRLSTSLMQDPRKKTTRWLINTVGLLRSTAIEKQKGQLLVVDLDENRFYVADEEMDEEARSEAAKKGFALSGSLHFIEVQYPGKDRIGTGSAEIIFFPGGFSEQAVINMEDDDGERFCYKVAPLLPRIKVVEEWIRY